MNHLLVMAVVFFVIIPLCKGVWAMLNADAEERAAEPEGEIGATCRQAPAAGVQEGDNATLQWWRQRGQPFVVVETAGGGACFYTVEEIGSRLRESIVAGRHGAGVAAHVFAPPQEEGGEWQHVTHPLAEFSRGHFKLDVLFRPVWSHAMAGLKWGVLLGVALKLLDTALGLLVVEPAAGFCFLLAVAAVFIPRVGLLGIIVLAFVLGQFYEANFFLIGMVSALTGALLGSLPGMAAGGLIGLARQSKLARAPDAEPEGAAIGAKAAIMPLVAGCTLISLYLFVFNPWLLSMLGE